MAKINRWADKTKPIKCRYCDNPSRWNENTGRWSVLCGRPACAAKARDAYKKNMKDTYGTDNIMKLGDHQIKLMKGRAIVYNWGGDTSEPKYCLSKNEVAVCEYLDNFGFNAEDVMVGEKVLTYKFKGKKHNHIIDFFIPEYKLVISVKDDADNPNTRPSVIEDRKKNYAEYQHILKHTDYSFIQIEGLKFAQFEKLERILDRIKIKPNIRLTYAPIIDKMFLQSLSFVIRDDKEIFFAENSSMYYVIEEGMKRWLDEQPVDVMECSHFVTGADFGNYYDNSDDYLAGLELSGTVTNMEDIEYEK